MGLDFLLFCLWGRLKKVKRNAANFINPPPIIPGIERGQIQPEWYLLLAQIGQKLFLKITMFQNFESVFRVVLFKRGRLLNLCPRAWMLSLFPFDPRFNRNPCWLISSSTFAQSYDFHQKMKLLSSVLYLGKFRSLFDCFGVEAFLFWVLTINGGTICGRMEKLMEEHLLTWRRLFVNTGCK